MCTMSSAEASVEKRYLEVDADVRRLGSERNSIPKLVVVSKFHGVEMIRPLLKAGHRVFGESRVNEAREKWRGLREEYPDVDMHFIGRIQSRRIREIVELFDTIQSVDRVDVAASIARESSRLGRRIECLIQVNIGREPQKSGVLPENIDTLYRRCVEDLQLHVRGFMCIPPSSVDPSMYFRAMHELKAIYGLPELSMGMSRDYHLAVNCGATMIRVGERILGCRPTVPGEPKRSEA